MLQVLFNNIAHFDGASTIQVLSPVKRESSGKWSEEVIQVISDEAGLLLAKNSSYEPKQKWFYSYIEI